MKRITILLFVLLLSFSLFGCNSDAANDEPKGTASQTPIASQPETEDPAANGPSQTVIQKDLEDALAVKNGYATITDHTIVKSMTEETSYSVTLSVSAETKYADWQYEVDMDYTKYDQGWMLDDVEWITANYLLTRIPSESEMISFANDFFSTHEYESINKLAGITAGSIRSDNVSETGLLSFSWSTDIIYKHGISTAEYDSEWYYDAQKDNWALATAEDTTNSYSDDLKIIETIHNVEVTRDFSGEWSLGSGNTIAISSFSSSGFDATWEGNSGSFRHLISMTGNYLNFAPNFMWYTDGSNYLCLQFKEDKTDLLICQLGSSVYFSAFAEITEELPYYDYY